MLNRWSVRVVSSALLACSLGLTVACSAQNSADTSGGESDESATALQACTVVGIEDIVASSATAEGEEDVADAETTTETATAVDDVDEPSADAASDEAAVKEDDTPASGEKEEKGEKGEKDEKGEKGEAIEAVVKLDCGGTEVDVTWRQFRKKLKVNPLKFRDSLPQFEARINCVQSADAPNKVLCQTSQQEGTEEFQTLRVQPNQ